MQSERYSNTKSQEGHDILCLNHLLMWNFGCVDYKGTITHIGDKVYENKKQKII